MSEHRHGFEEPPTVERIVTMRVTFRRGSGCCERSPVRVVSAYYDSVGVLLFDTERPDDYEPRLTVRDAEADQ